MVDKNKNLFSISEVSHNFSKIVKTVDENNSVIILKNNKPKYILSAYTEKQFSENDMLELIARRILSEHKHAFDKLGKL